MFPHQWKSTLFAVYQPCIDSNGKKVKRLIPLTLARAYNQPYSDSDIVLARYATAATEKLVRVKEIKRPVIIDRTEKDDNKKIVDRKKRQRYNKRYISVNGSIANHIDGDITPGAINRDTDISLIALDSNIPCITTDTTNAQRKHYTANKTHVLTQTAALYINHCSWIMALSCVRKRSTGGNTMMIELLNMAAADRQELDRMQAIDDSYTDLIQVQGKKLISDGNTSFYLPIDVYEHETEHGDFLEDCCNDFKGGYAFTDFADVYSVVRLWLTSLAKLGLIKSYDDVWINAGLAFAACNRYIYQERKDAEIVCKSIEERKDKPVEMYLDERILSAELWQQICGFIRYQTENNPKIVKVPRSTMAARMIFTLRCTINKIDRISTAAMYNRIAKNGDTMTVKQVQNARESIKTLFNSDIGAKFIQSIL